jgi:hypothetical protein
MVLPAGHWLLMMSKSALAAFSDGGTKNYPGSQQRH